MRRTPMEGSRRIGGALGAVKVARPAVGGGKPETVETVGYLSQQSACPAHAFGGAGVVHIQC